MYKLILILILISTEGNSVPTSSIFVEDVAFLKLGTYRGFTDDGTEYQKSYLYPKYLLKASWLESRAICNSYNLELATIETLAEAQAILHMANNGNHFSNLSAYVDAMALTLKSPTDWYWTKSGKKLSFALPWYPGEPNNHNNLNEACLSFHNGGFNDASCSFTTYSFVCQRIDFMIPKALSND